MTKRYYWLKLGENFFCEKEIKKLRKIAGGDTFTIIYLKLMLLSLKDNGRLYYDGLEDTFPEEIALVVDEDAENVRMTMNYLLRAGLIEEISDSEVSLTQIPEMTGSESDSAKRVRAHRERRRLEGNSNKPLLCNDGVTDCNTEIDIDKELEKELDIVSNNTARISDSFNNICKSIPKVTRLTDKRKQKINARLKSFTEAELIKAFHKVEESDFLTGRNGKWAKGASFDWLMKSDENILKVLEGNYDNPRSANRYDAARDRLNELFEGAI